MAGSFEDSSEEELRELRQEWERKGRSLRCVMEKEREAAATTRRGWLLMNKGKELEEMAVAKTVEEFIISEAREAWHSIARYEEK